MQKQQKQISHWTRKTGTPFKWLQTTCGAKTFGNKNKAKGWSEQVRSWGRCGYHCTELIHYFRSENNGWGLLHQNSPAWRPVQPRQTPQVFIVVPIGHSWSRLLGYCLNMGITAHIPAQCLLEDIHSVAHEVAKIVEKTEWWGAVLHSCCEVNVGVSVLGGSELVGHSTA